MRITCSQGEGPVCFYDPRTKQYQVGPAREIEKRSLEAARETGKYRISPDRERELKEGMEVISLSELEEAGRDERVVLVSLRDLFAGVKAQV